MRGLNSRNCVGLLTLFGALVSCREGSNDVGPETPWLQPPAHWTEVPEPLDNSLNVARWDLGKRMFFDSQFSIDGSISCASCHQPPLAFASATSTSPGANGALGTRNVPSLANVGYFPYFLREGGVPTLEMQVLVPIQEENEFHHNIVVIAERLKDDETYVAMSLEAYGEEPSPFVVTRALAAFQRGLVSGFSPYDQWVGEETGALSSDALDGLEVFQQVGCDRCHGGEQFTDHRILNNGLYGEYDDPGLARLTGREEDRGKFKVPSLRNVGVTAPYMFDGSLSTLDDVIEHYSAGGSSHPNQAAELEPFELSATQKDNLKAFLHSLTDPTFLEWAKNLEP